MSNAPACIYLYIFVYICIYLLNDCDKYNIQRERVEIESRDCSPDRVHPLLDNIVAL